MLFNMSRNGSHVTTIHKSTVKFERSFDWEWLGFYPVIYITFKLLWRTYYELIWLRGNGGLQMFLRPVRDGKLLAAPPAGGSGKLYGIGCQLVWTSGTLRSWLYVLCLRSAPSYYPFMCVPCLRGLVYVYFVLRLGSNTSAPEVLTTGKSKPLGQ